MSKQHTFKLLLLLTTTSGCIGEAQDEPQTIELGSDKSGNGGGSMYRFNFSYNWETELREANAHNVGLTETKSDTVTAKKIGRDLYTLRGPLYTFSYNGGIRYGGHSMCFTIEPKGFNQSEMAFMFISTNSSGQWNPRTLVFDTHDRVDRDEHEEGTIEAIDRTCVQLVEKEDDKIYLQFEYLDGSRTIQANSTAPVTNVKASECRVDGCNIEIGFVPVPTYHWWSIQGDSDFTATFTREECLGCF